MDRKYIVSSLLYAVIGLLLGVVMAASGDHGQLVTHAHIMLAGFVVSFIYGLLHKLWLNNSTSMIAKTQFYIHQIGVAVLVVGLFLLYGGIIPLETIDPILALASISVLLGMILMTFLFVQKTQTA